MKLPGRLISQNLVPASLHYDVSLINACFSLQDIFALTLYFTPHDSAPSLLIRRRSDISQKAMRRTAMTVSNFHTSGLYLCVMTHTVAACFCGCVLPFSPKASGSTFSPWIASRKFFLSQAALCNKSCFLILYTSCKKKTD